MPHSCAPTPPPTLLSWLVLDPRKAKENRHPTTWPPDLFQGECHHKSWMVPVNLKPALLHSYTYTNASAWVIGVIAQVWDLGICIVWNVNSSQSDYWLKVLCSFNIQSPLSETFIKIDAKVLLYIKVLVAQISSLQP